MLPPPAVQRSNLLRIFVFWAVLVSHWATASLDTEYVSHSRIVNRNMLLRVQVSLEIFLRSSNKVTPDTLLRTFPLYSIDESKSYIVTLDDLDDSHNDGSSEESSQLADSSLQVEQYLVLPWEFHQVNRRLSIRGNTTLSFLLPFQTKENPVLSARTIVVTLWEDDVYVGGAMKPPKMLARRLANLPRMNVKANTNRGSAEVSVEQRTVGPFMLIHLHGATTVSPKTDPSLDSEGEHGLLLRWSHDGTFPAWVVVLGGVAMVAVTIWYGWGRNSGFADLRRNASLQHADYANLPDGASTECQQVNRQRRTPELPRTDFVNKENGHATSPETDNVQIAQKTERNNNMNRSSSSPKAQLHEQQCSTPPEETPSLDSRQARWRNDKVVLDQARPQLSRPPSIIPPPQNDATVKETRVEATHTRKLKTSDSLRVEALDSQQGAFSAPLAPRSVQEKSSCQQGKQQPASKLKAPLGDSIDDNPKHDEAESNGTGVSRSAQLGQGAMKQDTPHARRGLKLSALHATDVASDYRDNRKTNSQGPLHVAPQPAASAHCRGTSIPAHPRNQNINNASLSPMVPLERNEVARRDSVRGSRRRNATKPNTGAKEDNWLRQLRDRARSHQALSSKMTAGSAARQFGSSSPCEGDAKCSQDRTTMPTSDALQGSKVPKAETTGRSIQLNTKPAPSASQQIINSERYTCNESTAKPPTPHQLRTSSPRIKSKDSPTKHVVPASQRKNCPPRIESNDWASENERSSKAANNKTALPSPKWTQQAELVCPLTSIRNSDPPSKLAAVKSSQQGEEPAPSNLQEDQRKENPDHENSEETTRSSSTGRASEGDEGVNAEHAICLSDSPSNASLTPQQPTRQGEAAPTHHQNRRKRRISLTPTTVENTGPQGGKRGVTHGSTKSSRKRHTPASREEKALRHISKQQTKRNKRRRLAKADDLLLPDVTASASLAHAAQTVHAPVWEVGKGPSKSKRKTKAPRVSNVG